MIDRRVTVEWLKALAGDLTRLAANVDAAVGRIDKIVGDPPKAPEKPRRQLIWAIDRTPSGKAAQREWLGSR
nr:hypothetical protein [Flavimaribacter sediminis]